MKIIVIGGTGLIGSKVVANLKQKDHEALAAAPNTGVNTITGDGLKDEAGTQVVVDVANSPSFEDKAVLEFFETSGRNLLAGREAMRQTGNRPRRGRQFCGPSRGLSRKPGRESLDADPR